MSHRGHDHWLSFTDLMAGVTSVLMIMFVLSVAMARIERENLEKSQAGAIGMALRQIKDEIQRQHMEGMARVDLNDQTIILEDATFESASACLDPRAIQNLSAWSDLFRNLLSSHPDVEIFIEGHTDRKPLTRTLNRCGAFDDNFTLSTVRARNARNVFVGSWSDALQARVSLAGFGPSHPLPDVDLDSPRQRRVAIRLLSSPSNK